MTETIKLLSPSVQATDRQTISLGTDGQLAISDPSGLSRGGAKRALREDFRPGEEVMSLALEAAAALGDTSAAIAVSAERANVSAVLNAPRDFAVTSEMVLEAQKKARASLAQRLMEEENRKPTKVEDEAASIAARERLISKVAQQRAQAANYGALAGARVLAKVVLVQAQAGKSAKRAADGAKSAPKAKVEETKTAS